MLARTADVNEFNQLREIDGQLAKARALPEKNSGV
jgi:hypothetical protein